MLEALKRSSALGLDGLYITLGRAAQAQRYPRLGQRARGRVVVDGAQRHAVGRMGPVIARARQGVCRVGIKDELEFEFGGGGVHVLGAVAAGRPPLQRSGSGRAVRAAALWHWQTARWRLCADLLTGVTVKRKGGARFKKCRAPATRGGGFFGRQIMDISSLCRHEIISVSANASVRDAALAMRTHHVGSLIVTDPLEKGRAIGVITDRDLVINLLAPGAPVDGQPVGNLCSTELIGIVATATVGDAVQAMRNAGVRRLLVVRPDGGLVGLVSSDDLFEAIAGEFGALAG